MIFALLYLLAAPPFLLPNADSLIVSNWTVKEGLPGNSVNRIVQDADGFLWLSSYYGLVRFDGLEFTTLEQANTPALRNNRLNLFHKAPDGTVWVSLERMGLIRYADRTFTRYDSEKGLTDEYVTVINTLPDGRLVVGTYDGVYVLEPDDRFRRIDLGSDPLTNQVMDVVRTSTGQVWALGFNGYADIGGATPKRYGSGYVSGIAEDASSRVWLGRKDGLWILAPDGSLSRPPMVPAALRDIEITTLHRIGDRFLVTIPGRSFLLEEDRFVEVGGVRIPEDDQVASAHRDSYGLDWVITQKGVPLLLKGRRYESSPVFSDLAEASVHQLFEDDERNLWFSTRYGGLFRVKRNPLRHIGIPEGLRGDNTLGLFVDSRNRLFIGTRDDGFSVVDQGRIRSYPTDVRRRYGTVYDFAEDESGRIWVGTFPHGLVLFDEPKQALVHIRLGPSVLENDIRAMHAAGNRILWLATSAGLVRFDTDSRTYERFDRSSGMPSQSLRNITADAQGRLWIATSDKGVFRYDPVSRDILHLHAGNGLPSDHIRAVMIDPDDAKVMWFGSETRGLIRYKAGSFRVMDVADGLPDRVVHSIRQGPLGWLWVSTNAGVVRIHKAILNEVLDGRRTGVHAILYDEDDGMRNLEANGGFRSGSLITPDQSHILVSTQGGVVAFPLAKPDPTKPPPPVYLLDGAAHHREHRLVLQGGRNDADIRYVGLRYSSPNGIRYQYRMVGISEEWIDDFDRDELHFHALKPGEYRFEVISWNEAGTLSSEPAVMTVVVKPTLLQMPLFWLLLLSVSGGGVWWLMDRRSKQFRTVRERLEVLVEDRTRDLRAEKAEVEKQKAIIEEQAAHLEDLIQTRDKFFAVVGHDLRGPFQNLLGLTQLLLEEYEELDDLEIRQSLKHLRSSSENLHRLVENLLEWSTLQKGGTKLFLELIDVNALAESVVRQFGPSASVKGIHLEAIVPDQMVVEADRAVLETITRNLVSNAIKFTKSEGIVVLEAGRSDDAWWLQVSDNGIGMTEAMRRNILSIDTSVKRRGTLNEWGTGLGLALSAELMKIHGGEIVVESEEGTGSRFTARFHNRS